MSELMHSANVRPHRPRANGGAARSRTSCDDLSRLVASTLATGTSPQGTNTRRGGSILEVLVACTLLSAVLSVATPLIIRHNRLLAAHREYQMALDELSNQLERLTALPAAELASTLERLAPSELTAAHLQGAKLSGELAEADQGQRLTLHLVWDEPQHKSAPVSLAAWIYRRADAPSQEASP